MKLSQGANANKSGSILEDQIGLVFSAHKFVEFENKYLLDQLIAGMGMDELGDRWFSKQLAIYKNIYGAKFKSDLFVYDKDLWPKGLVIECKYQRDGGSVDEKYVFTVLSLKSVMSDSVLLLTGGGARNCAINWAKEQETKRFKFCGSIDQFNNWISKLLK